MNIHITFMIITYLRIHPNLYCAGVIAVVIKSYNPRVISLSGRNLNTIARFPANP